MLRLYNLKGEEILILRHSRKIDSYIQGEAFEITVSKSKDGTKEMSFQIPIHIDIDSIQEVNERWVNLQVGLLLRYEEKDDTVDWYRITEIEDKRDSLATCQITAKHTSYDLNRKGLGKVIDLVDTPEVILNAILSGTGWSVGTISSSLVSKVRTFTAEAKSNCLEMLNKVAEIFKGYLQFNGDYTVDLLEDIGNKQGQVSFRYKKNLINVQRTVSFDSLISKLWLYGGDDGTGVISIESVNPTKNSFIYNFSYFLQTGQMPNNAEQIIAQYNIDILAVNTNISNTQANINAKNTELISLEAQLQYKQNLLTARQNLLSEIEAKIALTDPSDLSYPTLLNEKNKTQTEINNLLVQVSSLSSQVNDLQDLIDSYIDTLENYQNQKEIIENNFQEVLGDFIFEGIETENDIIDPQELFEDGIKLLDKACYPAITYNLTIADLSKLSGYEIESISLGDRIHCFDELLNLDIELEITKIIEVVDNWENTKLEVGNMNTVFEDLFKRIVDSANTVKNKQSNWDNNTKTVQQALAEAIEAQRLANTALQRADGKVDAFSQAVMPHPEYINVPENSIYDNYVGDLWHDTTSDKTYWYEKSPNGSNYDYKWVEKSIPKEVFDMIDGKNTVFYNTPTPPYHVGDLWSLGDNEVDLRICIVERLTGSFNPADWGLATNAKAYIDQEISDVNSVISELETEITTTFKDGVISEAEANSIATYLNLLNTEKADVDKRYDLIYGDTNLSGITKTNLANAKTSYNTAHTNLINSINTAIADGKITPEEKTDIDNKFTAYKNALIVLTQRFEESVRFIEQVKANAAENNAKTYADEQIELVEQDITDVDNRVTNLNIYIDNTFKDGIITTSEAQAIEKYINSLTVEKQDIDNRYAIIYADSYLTGTPKTNLENAKIAYNTAHTNLINSINTAIADGQTSPTEKADVDTKFTSYKTALGALSTRFEEAIRSVEQAKANTAEGNAKTYADQQIDIVEQDISDVDGRVTSLNQYVDGTFKDGIVTESEAKAIEKYLNSLSVEKQDIDNRYTNIYADAFLTGTAKTNLLSAKTGYDTAHTNLINSINTAIADGQTSPTEKADVDTKFTSYKTALGALSTRFEEAIRSVEQAKANAAENNAKDYIDQEISDVNSVISELETEVTTTFKDGVISEAEANSIATYLNLLNTEKADVDKRYDLIYGDTNLSGITKTNLANAKTSYNTAHTNLINSINTAIADGKITPEEKTDIDNKFTAYKNALIVLTQRFEESVRFIEQVKANAAENNAKTYADEQIELVEQDITDVDNRVTNLNIYIDNTFKDGIITTSEAQAIEKYINSLTVEKQDIDNRYAIIYADSYLTGTPKTNLENAKIAYNTAHTNLINSINTAIADGQTSPTEKADVDTKFTSYKTALGALSTRFEEAIRSVEQAKANTAEGNAKTYADQQIDIVEQDISDVDGRVTSLNQYVDGTFKDGIVTESEAKAIEKYLNSLSVEKQDIDNRYTNIYADAFLTGTAKTNLLSAKTGYDTAHTNLINSINTAIADGQTSPTEKADVDTKFTSYKTALGALSTRFEEAIRSVEQAKANAAENNAKDYIDQEISDVNSVISELETEITTTFKDGVISEAEANSIATYLNLLNTEKADVDKRYDLIYGDTNLSGITKTNLANAKTSYNTAHTNLINSINTAIADGKITPEEKTDIDNKFTAYKNALIVLTQRFEESVRFIEQVKANAAENNAKTYADEQIELVEQDITDVDNRVTNLNIYIDNTFKDGIITTSEAQAIEKYINSLTVEKQDIDNRYAIIYADSYLTGTPKTNLENAKIAYNTAHTNLINSINTAIADGQTSPTEKADVDTKFTSYKTALGALSTRFEEAIRSVEQAKANTAEGNAKTYADQQIDIVEQDISDVDGRVTSLNQYVDGTFKDGIVTESEAKAIEKYLNSLSVEKQDIDNRYTNIYADAFLTGTAKTNLLSAKTGYDTAHTNLINSINTAIADGQTSPTEKADVDTKFTSYKTALGALSTRFEEAIRSVEQAKANAAENNAKDYVDLEIGEVNNAIEGLEENINKFSSDLILTLAEANFIKLSLENLTSESTDLINIATSLSIATEKTNYQNALTTLTNYLNTNWLGKTYPLTITSGQRTNVTNYFKDVEDKKSILVNKIVAVREANAKQYTDDTANAKIADMADDNKLTPNEKIAVLNDKDIIVAEYTSILAQGTAYGITTEKTNYTNAYNALISYLTPLLTDLSSTSSIDGAEFRTKFSNYYNTKAILLKAVSDKAVQQANLYNGIMITEQNGFQVFDNQSTPVDRIKMGQISPGIFGQRLKYANGNVSSETLSDGTQRMYDKDGNIIFDSGGLNPLEIAGFGIVRGLTFQATNISYAFKATTTVKNDYIAGSANLYLNSVANIAVGDHIIVDYADGFTSKNHVVTGVYTDYVTVKTGTSSPYSFPKDIKAGTTVCIISQSVRNGSTCDITISAGSATLPNGKYITINSEQVLTSVDCKANPGDADGFEIRILWLGSDGVVRIASVGTVGSVTEIYANVYTYTTSSLSNPRTVNLGTGTNTPDANAIIIGHLLVGWGLGYHPPQLFYTTSYRDERPIQIEKNYGSYSKTILASSNVIFGEEKIGIFSIVANVPYLYSIPIGYGVKCVIASIWVNGTNGGLIIARLLDTLQSDCMGTTAIEISSTPKIVLDKYPPTDDDGVLLSPNALLPNVSLKRAWLEVGYDRQVYLQLSFISTESKIVAFRMFYQGF